MRKSLWFWITLLVVAVALAACAVLLVDYQRPAPVFCGPGGGCETVKRTIYAYPLGVPLPAFGLVGLLSIAVAVLLPGRLAAIAQASFAGFGASVAIFLFVVQARMGVLCPYCAVVDTGLIVLAVSSAIRLKVGWQPPTTRLVSMVAVTVLVVAVVTPILIGSRKAPIPVLKPTIGVPEGIAEELARSPKGVLTIVDFADFECPFCRMTHETLKPILAAHPGKIRVVRRHVPLRMHAHAMDAARAGFCAEGQGKGDELADALFEADPETLTPSGCEALARTHGLDLEAFRRCVSDAATDARIERDREMWKKANGRALPTLWIGTTEMVGAKDRAAVEAIVADALRAL